MNGSSTVIRRSANQEIRGFRNFLWISMLMSTAIVFFGMQLMMVGPLQGRLDDIQTRLDHSESSMKKLVAARDTVWKTNDLLSSLEDQAVRWNQVKGSIADLQTLRNRITQEAQAATVALSSLDRMASVQNRILSEHEKTHQAVRHLESLHELQARILQGSELTDVAGNSLDGMVAIQNRVIAASSSFEEASRGISHVAELTQRLIAQSDDLRLAAERFDQFVSLKDTILSSAEGITAADENARILVAMNDRLSAGDTEQLTRAAQNLDSLESLQQSLSRQTSALSAAIQNLEIMDDFQTEVSAHISTLSTLRRSMLELAMMESTMGRVARVIEPLSEIGNLRRLSEAEVREAARVILDRRMTRFTRHDDASVFDQLPDLSTDEHDEDGDLVPVPPEAR